MTDAKRFYVQGEIAETATLTEGEFHHAVNVMRVRVGDRIILCNGDGQDYFGQVEAIAKRDLLIKIIEKRKNPCDPKVRVTLFQAICKGERMELIAQKCNELGVSKIVPFTSQFTNVPKTSHKAERMEKIAQESAKQCGRASATEIASITDFSDALKLATQECDRIVIAYEHAEDGSLALALKGVTGEQSIALFVGSEGGFSPQEVETAVNGGAYAVTMGTRILRAETAAIALTSAVMCLCGEWTR